MAILTQKDLAKIEESYYWSGYRKWIPFPEELKIRILEVYGEEPFPNYWTEQDIHEGSRKIIRQYFNA